MIGFYAASCYNQHALLLFKRKVNKKDTFNKQGMLMSHVLHLYKSWYLPVHLAKQFICVEQHSSHIINCQRFSNQYTDVVKIELSRHIWTQNSILEINELKAAILINSVKSHSFISAVGLLLESDWSDILLIVY